VSRKVRLHPTAQQELHEAAAFYDLEGPGLGSAFVDDLERAAEQVRLMPESSPVARGAVRKKLMARFPYSVVYSLVNDEVVVLAVAHNRRRPFYWQDRL
jgi:plasmid stabilization system protein ParE